MAVIYRGWMKYDHIIWDFNGTVLCDMEAGIRATNEMLAARALPLLAPRARP